MAKRFRNKMQIIYSGRISVKAPLCKSLKHTQLKSQLSIIKVGTKKRREKSK
jgi:hypothetical protein